MLLHILAIANNAAIYIGLYMFFEINVLDYSEVELLGK